MNIRVSVVTISFNEVANVGRTLKSVLTQTYSDIEYIVQDGGSSDGTVREIENFANEVKSKSAIERSEIAEGLREQRRFSFKWGSERDGGIYFGMNKGLDRCTGDYVIFCNAGDEFVSNDVIEKMVAAAEANGMPDLVFGDCASEIDGKLMTRKAHGPSFMKFGMPAAHEAMMYKLDLIRKLGLRYDTTYRISADYKFTYEFVNAAKTFARVDAPIIRFSEGGISTANRWKGLSEACRVRREVGNLSFAQRAYVRLAQTAALLLSTYAKPLYRAIRMNGSRGKA